MREQLTLDDALNAAVDEHIERLIRDEYPRLSGFLDESERASHAYGARDHSLARSTREIDA